MSVDGTDFMMPFLGPMFFSQKFNDSALRYEVGVGIISGFICWISGPWAPGLYNDVQIFHQALKTHLEQFERIEADDGYIGEAPLKVKCPASVVESEERKMLMTRVRRRHETVNRRFKQWQILKQKFRHDILKHSDVFHAIAVVTQLSIQNGDPLFPVEYVDED
jgi:hypothetical protein